MNSNKSVWAVGVNCCFELSEQTQGNTHASNLRPVRALQLETIFPAWHWTWIIVFLEYRMHDTSYMSEIQSEMNLVQVGQWRQNIQCANVSRTHLYGEAKLKCKKLQVQWQIYYGLSHCEFASHQRWVKANTRNVCKLHIPYEDHETVQPGLCFCK